MALAVWRGAYEIELRADFQQFYGLNIDEMGKSYSVSHAAALAVMLPEQSRVIRLVAPYASWGLEHQLLAIVANATRDLVWLEGDQKRRASNRPKPIEPPKKRNTDAVYLTSDDYLKQLENLRKGV